MNVDINAVVIAVVSLDDRIITFALRCLHPPVTLAPVRRGEGRGVASRSLVESQRLTLAGAPLTLPLSPEDGGEGIGMGIHV